MTASDPVVALVTSLEPGGAADDVEELWAIYDAVFGDRDRASWEQGMTAQAARDGFRLVRARADGRLAGFAHGHTGEPGQWWTDRATEALGPELAQTWVGGHFEVIELAVLPAHRGAGLGRLLMRQLCADLPHERLLLTTSADPEDPARRLYASLGWTVVGPFSDDVVVLGRRR